MLPVLYALIPPADHTGQGRYALFAVPMGALLIGIGLDRAADVGRAGTRAGTTMARWAVTAGLVLACALGTAGLLAEHAIACQAWSDGGFTVVRPATKVTPGMVPAAILG